MQHCCRKYGSQKANGSYVSEKGDPSKLKGHFIPPAEEDLVNVGYNNNIQYNNWKRLLANPSMNHVVDADAKAKELVIGNMVDKDAEISLERDPLDGSVGGARVNEVEQGADGGELEEGWLEGVVGTYGCGVNKGDVTTSESGEKDEEDTFKGQDNVVYKNTDS
ncbi:hypothetical protein H5410_047658 [Solanum commersonii]|uniref:Uncharacterized protein n=1 Tax=Solanum commersonii TaxID=4109 RepID=A0A9J5XJQ2_SOLCO|nr:hypothetical protein H5410_047658 [Solanum commersonii]